MYWKYVAVPTTMPRQTPPNECLIASTRTHVTSCDPTQSYVMSSRAVVTSTRHLARVTQQTQGKPWPPAQDSPVYALPQAGENVHNGRIPWT